MSILLTPEPTLEIIFSLFADLSTLEFITLVTAIIA